MPLVNLSITCTLEEAEHLRGVLNVGNDEDSTDELYCFIEDIACELQDAHEIVTGEIARDANMVFVSANASLRMDTIPAGENSAYAKYEETADERLRTVM